jgi:hypothetical protein
VVRGAAVLNIFGTTGQERRAWLDRQAGNVFDTMSYYLGPSGIPERVNALAQGLQYTDAGDYMEAADASQALWNDPSLANAARYTAAGAAMALPFIGSRGVNELSNNAIDWLADEDGAIRAWHGSPHDFDRFSMDKIGTGEGAQAYGHGLYFAEAESVADSYARSLGALHQGAGQAPELAKYALDAKGGDYERAANMVRAQIAEATDASPAELQELRTTLYLLENKTDRLGRLYEVEINANPEDFLDWDAPLSAQPQIADRLRQIERFNYIPQGSPVSIEDAKAGAASWDDAAHWGATGQHFAPKNEPSIQAFREAGIPGIRYLDAGSRGAGDGSRNYVVFDDQLITILNKYGLAGLAAGGLGYGMAQEDQY